MVIGLCRAFPALTPAQALKADAGLLRLLDVYRLGHPEPEGGEQ